MAEYIDRGTLREILDGWRDAHADVDDVHGCGLLEDVICEVDAQTAADVAPVVHCRSCKHQVKKWFSDKRMKQGGYYFCDCDIMENCDLGKDDDFCSRGERKTT